MTTREFLTAIVDANLSDELTQFATEGLAKLDKRNAARSSKPSKTAVANAPIKEAIVAFLDDHGQAIAAEVATGVDITPPKASALCVQLVKEGRIGSVDVKIPKKGKVKAYFIIDGPQYTEREIAQ